jgi:hypothetical protein
MKRSRRTNMRRMKMLNRMSLNCLESLKRKMRLSQMRMSCYWKRVKMRMSLRNSIRYYWNSTRNWIPIRWTSKRMKS